MIHVQFMTDAMEIDAVLFLPSPSSLNGEASLLCLPFPMHLDADKTLVQAPKALLSTVSEEMASMEVDTNTTLVPEAQLSAVFREPVKLELDNDNDGLAFCCHHQAHLSSPNRLTFGKHIILRTNRYRAPFGEMYLEATSKQSQMDMDYCPSEDETGSEDNISRDLEVGVSYNQPLRPPLTSIANFATVKKLANRRMYHVTLHFGLTTDCLMALATGQILTKHDWILQSVGHGSWTRHLV
ncbi:hypothetical protein C8R45DRAFT_947914 [Mycena sanguinolenta]|nr:hypothetical protein C8R45DRAFT_947914 [Mycena sanguinolenta]